MRKYLRLVLVLAAIIGIGLFRQIKASNDDLLGAGLEPDPSHVANLPSPTAAAEFPTAAPTVVPIAATAAAPVATVTPAATVAPTVTPTPGPRQVMKLASVPVFADGTFTGPPARTSYGEMILRVTMHEQRLEAVEVVEYPDRTPTSIRLSDELIPTWVEMAVNEQEWRVDAVSGATQTARAFQKALVLALRAAART